MVAGDGKLLALRLRAVHRRDAPRLHQSAVRRATSCCGIGSALRRPGRAGSCTVHTRVSKPSTASAPSLLSRCVRSKLERPHRGEARLDDHVVAEPRRQQEARPRLDHRIAGEFVGLVAADACSCRASARSARWSSDRTWRNSAGRTRCRQDRNRPIRCAPCAYLLGISIPVRPLAPFDRTRHDP